jgi:hypothetical protein
MQWRHRSPAAALALLATLAAAAPGEARAQLAHIGDGTSGGHASWVNDPENQSNQIVFDSFVVPVGQTWHPGSIFADFEQFRVDPQVTALHWQIRSGMSAEADVGTVVASGAGAAAISGNRYTVTVDGVTLGPGEYWVGMYADLAGITSLPFPDDPFFGPMAATGAGSANAPRDGRSLLLIEPDADLTGGFVEEFAQDISYGIDGTIVVSAVPEPGTWTLLATGMLALGVARRRRVTRP